MKTKAMRAGIASVVGRLRSHDESSDMVVPVIPTNDDAVCSDPTGSGGEVRSVLGYHQ